MTGRKLILPLVMSMMLLAGCASVPQAVVIVPKLESPPHGSISALETQCKVRKDTATCKWIVDLSKHYDKLDRVTK